MIFASLLLVFASPVAPAAQPPPSALTSVGRDLTVSENVTGRVVAVFGNVVVNARVEGDVIVWGGDVSIGRGGSIGGNLSVFGGQIEAPPDGRLPVDGTVSTPGTLLNVYLAEMYHAPWEARPRAAAFRGLRVVEIGRAHV